METLTAALSRLVADVVTFKFVTHGAHWDVEGPNFPQYHALFAEIYDDADSSVDPLAENIRKLGALPPSSLSEFVALRSFDDAPATTDASALLARVASTNDAVLATLSAAFDAAINANEQGTANFIAERIDAHQKWRWQLRATIGAQPVQQVQAAVTSRPVTVSDAVAQQVINTFKA